MFDRKLNLTKLTLHFETLPLALDGMTILQIGDLHTQGYTWKEKCVKEIVSHGADMILCSGDFCFQRSIINPFCFQPSTESHLHSTGLTWHGYMFEVDVDMSLDVVAKIFEGHYTPMGIHCVQGNHDPDLFMERLPDLGITALSNSAYQVKHTSGLSFNLSGVKGLFRDSVDLVKTFENIDEDLFSICLCHYPELGDVIAASGVDLTLSGHTHGGQICLPSGKPIKHHSRSGMRFVKGLTEISRSQYIYTTRGLGYSMLSVRLFCDPEVVHITLKQGSSEQNTITEDTYYKSHLV